MDKFINIRASPIEIDELNKKAKKANQTKSEYLRQIIFSSVIKENDKHFQKKILFLLANISSNINQIAHHANINKKLDIEISNKLDEILRQSKNIYKSRNL